VIRSSERLVQPIEDPGKGDPARTNLAVRTRPFRSGEADHSLSAGQMIVQVLRLTFQKQVALRIADERGAIDCLCNTALQIIVKHPVLGESVLHTITFVKDETLLGGNLGKTRNLGANDGKNIWLVYPSRAAVVD
jgi:hypothetical protein